MKYFILSTIALFLFCVGATAQGTFRGKITDENGETIIGAAVYLKNNKAVGTITDLDGNFSLSIKDSLPQVIQISFVSYLLIEETIQVKKGQVVVKNFTMKPKENVIGNVEVIADAVKNKYYY